MKIRPKITPERIAELLIAERPYGRASASPRLINDCAGVHAEELVCLVYDNLEAPPPPTRDPRQLALW